MKKCPQCGKEFETSNTLCPEDGAVLQNADDSLIGKVLADKYRIESLISQGGMGSVYRATHVLMDKTVAVKVLHPSLAADDRIVARFSREAKATSRISHPHALSVTDFGESSDGTVFLVMEYLSGRTLKDVIKQDGPLSLPRAVEIFRQISSGLDAAHAQGVVHRDLKSDNIMLVDIESETDWAKVLDFGIAKLQEPADHDEALTAPNLIIGTPQYMSPEQCSQSDSIDHRADIYSLGIILFEMLSGHVPFSGESHTAIMMKHLQEVPPSILDERRDIPVGIDAVISRALSKNPGDRFETAGEFSEEFMAAATGLVPDAPVEPGAIVDSGKVAENIIKQSTEEIPAVGTAASNHLPIEDAEPDESTLVQRGAPKFERRMYVPVGVDPQASPAQASFNPRNVIIAAITGLVVLFAVVYAITGRSKPEANVNETQPALASDPNSKPVSPAPPPTGDAEKGIAASMPAAPVQSVSNANMSTLPNRNIDDAARNSNAPNTANRNGNSENPSNSNLEGEPPLPASEKPATNNANHKIIPPPPINDSGTKSSDEPPPAPTPSSSPKKKPALPAPLESPGATNKPGAPVELP